MRIGYFIPSWPPGSEPNGIVTSLGHLGRQLRAMGHEVFYVTAFSNEREQNQSVTILDSHKNSSFLNKLRYKLNFEAAQFRLVSSAIADAVIKLVENNNIEIFQMEETHGWAGTVIRRAPIPVVVKLDGPWFLHGPLHPQENGRPENCHRIEREGDAIHHAAGVTAPSKNVLDLSTEFYGQLKCPTEVIPNPLPPNSREAVRWKLDSCDRNLILFVGRFDCHKGADILLRAFARLAQDRPAIRLLFVGPDVGLKSEGGRLIKFAEYVIQEVPSALRQRIEYRGVLPHNEIEKLRVQAYLTIVCSRYETFANTVLEAMGAGCPTIATNTGGIPEILLNNRTGLLVPAEDISGLAAAIGKMLDDPSLALRFGEQAARDCRDRFMPTKIAQQALNFYSTVITHYKERPPRDV
jgi:glycosyltransferase involved in cell wall biosynthesis